MRMFLPLFLASCAAPIANPSDPVDTGTDTGDTQWEDGPLPPPPIDQAAPAHVELATFALG